MHDNKLLGDAIAAGMVIGDPKGNFDYSIAPYAIVPDDAKLVSLEQYLEQPLRQQGSVTLNDADSFAEYFNAFKTPFSMIFADADKCSFTAVLDYHETAYSRPEVDLSLLPSRMRASQASGEAPEDTDDYADALEQCLKVGYRLTTALDPPLAGWREHTATHSCRPTNEWIRWVNQSGKAMNQVQFAEFIEDNLLDIHAPPGADLLELARNLEAKKTIKFSSSFRSTDGQRKLVYDEDVQSGTSKGDMKVPETFILGLMVFKGGASYKVEARLRYRFPEGKLSFSYDLVRPHKIIEAAFNDVFTKIAKECGTKILNGSYK